MSSPASTPRYVAHISEDGQRFESVATHLHEVAQMAQEFAQPFGAGSWAYAMGLAHDMGKFSSEFQNRILHNGYKVDHSTAGAAHIVGILNGLLSYGIAGHHGGLPDGGTRFDIGGTLAARLQKAKNGEIPDCSAWRQEIETIDPGDVPFSAKLMACDPNDKHFACAFLARMLFSCLVDADYLCTERFMSGAPRPQLPYDSIPTLLDRLEQRVAEFYPPQGTVNEHRCQILGSCAEAARLGQGVFSLSVPTGGGKTYASLRFALRHASTHGLRRVIYAVPYTSIIEQNADVYRSVLEDANVLEHHGNYDFDEPGDLGSDLQERLRLASENWDAPVVVTTNVQLFESLYASKTSRCRKLHNLAKSVIVLDEAQMIPTDRVLPCIKALAELVKRYDCTVVLCTATQPAFKQFFEAEKLSVTEIVNNPDDLSAALNRTQYQLLGSLEDDDLVSRLQKHDQVLCIVNSRAQAHHLYDSLAKEPQRDLDTSTFHLTTLMHPAHRRCVLSTINNRMRLGLPCRVVATSLVEAGVDLDFPVVYRALTGIDSIVQAAGRCNREGKRPASESWVNIFETATPYSLPHETIHRAAITRSTLQSLRTTELGSPQVIQQFFLTLYHYRTDGSRLAVGLDRDNTVEKLSHLQPILKPWPIIGIPFAEVAREFRFIDNAGAAVIIPDPAIAQDLEYLQSGQIARGTMRRIGRYSVNVYPNDCKKLLQSGCITAVSGIDNLYLLIDEKRYRNDVGLDLEIEEGVGLYW